MPLPTPDRSESRDAFVGRCMGDEKIVREYSDEKQRLAVCHSQWERQEKMTGKSFLESIAAKLAKGQPSVTVPAYISVVGSSTDPAATPNDVDVLIRDNPARLSPGQRESLMLLVRKFLDPDKSLGLNVHMLFNEQGPHLAPGQAYVPIFDLVLQPRRSLDRVAKDRGPDHSDGVMVALMVPRHAADVLAVEDGEDPDGMHVTLAYLGKRADLPSDVMDTAVAAVKAAVADFGPLDARANGIGRFFGSASSDGKDVIHATFDAPMLPELRHAVVDALDAAGLPVKRDHGFDPHITLAYVDPVTGQHDDAATTVLPDIEAPSGGVAMLIDAVSVVSGDARVDVPLARAKVEKAVDLLDGASSLMPYPKPVVRRPRRKLSYAQETDAIRANRETTAAQKTHPFRAAQWTHPNGHPRCLTCGSEEPISGICDPHRPAQKSAGRPDAPGVEARHVGRLPQADDPSRAVRHYRSGREVTDEDEIKAIYARTSRYARIGKGGMTVEPSLRFAYGTDMSAEDETAMITENARTADAREPHRFKKARHPNAAGDLRCLVCGNAEQSGAMCMQISKEFDESQHPRDEAGRFGSGGGGGGSEGRDIGHGGRDADGPGAAPLGFKGVWLNTDNASVSVHGEGFNVNRIGWSTGHGARQVATDLWQHHDQIRDWQGKGDRLDAQLRRTPGGKGEFSWRVTNPSGGSISFDSKLGRLGRKSLENEGFSYRVLKADNDQKYTLGVAYPANEVDAHGEFASIQELEKAAWSAMVRGMTAGVQHIDGTDGTGVPVESYIYRGPSWKVGDQSVEPGDWLLGVVWNDAAWAAIRAGKLTGYSIQGYARTKA